MDTLITGGAGFIGCNLADRLLREGAQVCVYDDFSRRGSRENAAWLTGRHPEALTIVEADVRDAGGPLGGWCERVDAVIHLAGQVAVTNSVEDPRFDFEVNALGTLNVLEAVRASARRPLVVFASTNKVYGGMEDLVLVEQERRYAYEALPGGVPWSRPLDFHSPYGCSKGAADQYVTDYARIYGLRTAVMRQSCVYGDRQFGTKDQGWVAHFAYLAVRGKPITVFGDGKQVRDMLYVDDLVTLYQAAMERAATLSGRAYNVGGGPANTVSLLEVLDFLERRTGRKLDVTFEDWRPGDQRIYVSDTGRAQEDFDWSPRVGVEDGLERLVSWVEENQDLMAIGHPDAGAGDP